MSALAPRVVAIDGAAGTGKSTLARALAAELGLPYLNTGSMYRALTAAALRAGVGVDDAAGLSSLMERMRFRVGEGDPPELEVEGWTREDLVTLEVETNVSAVSAHPEVRTAMRAHQRALGEGGAVIEGRDIGSAVFTDAPVKLFLEADPSARARRRTDERAGSHAHEDTVRQALHRRDERDAATVPHEPVPGAVVLDTTDRDAAATLAAALAVVAERAPELIR